MNEQRLEQIRLDLAIARDNTLTEDELAAAIDGVDDTGGTRGPSWPVAD